MFQLPKKFSRYQLRNAFRSSGGHYFFMRNPAMRRLALRAGLIAQPE